MIFILMVGGAFLYGAVKGFTQWKAQQVTVNQRPNRWWN